MAVDTHVFRVSARLGLTTNAKTPLAAEKQLIKNITGTLCTYCTSLADTAWKVYLHCPKTTVQRMWFKQHL